MYKKKCLIGSRSTAIAIHDQHARLTRTYQAHALNSEYQTWEVRMRLLKSVRL